MGKAAVLLLYAGQSNTNWWLSSMEADMHTRQTLSMQQCSIPLRLAKLACVNM